MRRVGIGEILLDDLECEPRTLEPRIPDDAGVILRQHRITQLAGGEIDAGIQVNATLLARPPAAGRHPEVRIR